MNAIVRHIPAFVEHDPQDRTRVDFDTLTQLLEIPFVKEWVKFPHFLRYSQSKYMENYLLVAEIAPSKESPAGQHWVIGRMMDRTQGLIDWVETPAQRKEREAWNRGEFT